MSARKQENFYRRDPMKALHGMVGLSMDEKATYNTMLDLLYASWKPLRDDDKADRLFIANWVGCAPQKLNPIIARLIERGRIIRIEIDGKSYLSDEAFEAERAKVKGVKVSEKSEEVGANSEEVDEKSGEVVTNLPLLDDESEQNQLDEALDKRREEERREDKNGGDDSAQEIDVDRDALGWPSDMRQWSTRILAETACFDPKRDQTPVNVAAITEYRKWHEAKYQWDIVVAVIREVFANKRDGPPNTMSYFTKPIRLAQENADRPIPEAQTYERRNPNYKTAGERNQDSTARVFGHIFGGNSAGEDEPFDAAVTAQPLRIA